MSGRSTELPPGRRVAYWRGRRGMSQQVFGDRIGKSKSWVDKIERGVRRLDRFSVLQDIADVLQIDVQLLLGKEPARDSGATNRIDEKVLGDIRGGLERYTSTVRYFGALVVAPDLAELRKAVSHAWVSMQHARYDTLAGLMPRLLRDAQAADAHHADGGDARPVAGLLAQVYQIASSMLRKIGEHELAWLAADRAMAVSVRADDQLLAGTAASRAGNAMLALGRARPALELNLSIAQRLAPDGPGGADPNRLSVYGILLLRGAMAAARLGNNPTVHDLIGAADEAATWLGADGNHYWTSFGPTNVRLHRAAAAVELGEAREAIDVHQALDPSCLQALPPERRADHLLDMSRAYAQVGDLSRAGHTLVEADRLAPAEIRCRPVAHAAMTDILRRTRGTPLPTVADLASQMGVGV